MEVITLENTEFHPQTENLERCMTNPNIQFN